MEKRACMCLLMPLCYYFSRNPTTKRARSVTSSTAVTAVPLANKPVTNAARSVVRDAEEDDGFKTARI